ncbi:PhzF family phenazine biosynthesis protein [Brassicibacter mesophilus]|uniref:PhzF family phenazine biosynthesis protein n=1 Tax=Brassicibacter mesophilus TaxID=745119 RepID=UPI003D1ADB40
MEVIIYQVDAFTEKPFGGNPAGVVPDARGLSELHMQRIANEMNLSETAFVIEKDSRNYEVRFFTPKCEVDLCGHATIATFYVLAQKGYIRNIDNGVITVHQLTKAGKLPVEIYFKDGNVEKVMMYQGTPCSFGVVNDTASLASILGISSDNIGVNGATLCPEIVSTGLADIIVPVRSKAVLDSIDIDFRKLEEFSVKYNALGAHVFCFDEDSDSTVFCRNFAPAVGINEEAATGTSNGALIHYLKKNNLISRDEMLAKQGQALNRPSDIFCQIEEKDGSYTVKVGGKANIVLQGIISL